MPIDPVLLVGGSGIVGRLAAEYLRAAHPELPLLIGGRDGAKAGEAAAAIGRAEGLALDLKADDLGLGDRRVSAIAVFFIDYRVAGLRLAQARGVPYLSMSSLGVHEIGLETAAFMQRPQAAPVVLGTEWFVGATAVPVLHLAERFGRLDTIRIAVLLDDEDAGGPQQAADLEIVTKVGPPVLGRRDGAYVWRVEDEARSVLRTIDGRQLEATALSPNDVLALAAATGAPNVEFNLATGTSSSRRGGEGVSTEVIVELSGTDRNGQALQTRHALLHPKGQMPPTALGVAATLERLLALDGGKAVPTGLYFPSQILEPSRFLKKLEEIGSRIVELEA